jgi:hypothetical protein
MEKAATPDATSAEKNPAPAEKKAATPDATPAEKNPTSAEDNPAPAEKNPAPAVKNQQPSKLLVSHRSTCPSYWIRKRFAHVDAG